MGIPDGASRRPVQPLRRNRDFLLLWSGQVVSTVGTRVSLLAYPLLVLALTGSPARAGLVGFAQTLPYLIWYVPAGALLDRWDRKRVMLVADAARAIAMGSVAVGLAVHRLTLAQLLVVAFVEGTGFVFFQISEGAALPHVVAREHLPAALARNQARNQARDQGAELAGQPLGGWLFGLGQGVPFVFDAVSYLVSFTSLLFIRPAFQEPRTAPRRRLAAEITEGAVWLWRHHLLRGLVVLIGATNLAFNVLPLAVIVRARQQHISSAGIGLMFGALGVGAILGALVAPAVQHRVPGRTVILASLWAWAGEMAALPVLQGPIATAATLAAGAVLGPVFNVVLAGYRYAVVPDQLMARVLGVSRLVAWGTIPVAALASGLLIQATSATATLVMVAVLMTAVAAAVTLTRTIRQAPSIADLTPARNTEREPGITPPEPHP